MEFQHHSTTFIDLFHGRTLVEKVPSLYWNPTLSERNHFILQCVSTKLPDIGPTGSVWQHQHRGLVFRQTGHYFQDYTFDP